MPTVPTVQTFFCMRQRYSIFIHPKGCIIKGLNRSWIPVVPNFSNFSNQNYIARINNQDNKELKQDLKRDLPLDPQYRDEPFG